MDYEAEIDELKARIEAVEKQLTKRPSEDGRRPILVSEFCRLSKRAQNKLRGMEANYWDDIPPEETLGFKVGGTTAAEIKQWRDLHEPT